MDENAEIRQGGCHCGAIRIRVRLPDGLDKPVRCNCSYCRMKGAVMGFVPLADLTVTTGADVIATYQFNTGAAKHHFCPVCGIHTHHQRRFDPTLYAVNLACLDGVSPYDFAVVPVIDGSHHPLDHGGGAMRIAGEVCYRDAG